MTEYTDLPWKTFREYRPGGIKHRIIRECHGGSDPTIAECCFETDANFIVTACNNYEKTLAKNEQLRKHGDFTDYEGRCQQFLRCRICKGRWEWEIEPPKHEENCPAIRNAEEQA